LPVQNGVLIAFACPPGRLLYRPAQTLTQKTAYMIVMKADFEMAMYDFGDTGRCPQLIGPAVSRSTLCQKIFQATQLRCSQLGRTVWMWLSDQPSRATRGGLAPAIYRRAIYPKKVRNVHGSFPLVQKFNSASPPPFEFLRRSNWSAHTQLDEKQAKKTRNRSPQKKPKNWRSCGQLDFIAFQHGCASLCRMS
jgi:hypothetical protein